MKRWIAALIALLLLLLSASCSVNSGEDAEAALAAAAEETVMPVETPQETPAPTPTPECVAVVALAPFSEALSALAEGADPRIVPVECADAADILQQAAELAADPAVGALVFAPAPEGTAEVLARIRTVRPQFLASAISPEEAAETVCSEADLTLSLDYQGLGAAAAEAAARLSAPALVFYSSALQLRETGLSEARLAMLAACEAAEIRFLDVSIPDPGEDADAAKAFLTEDVPLQVQDFGKNTAFFCTDVSLQETLREAAERCGGLCPLSPDMQRAAGGKRADWSISYRDAALSAAINYCLGELSAPGADAAAILAETGVEHRNFTYFEGTVIDNYFLLLCPWEIAK